MAFNLKKAPAWTAHRWDRQRGRSSTSRDSRWCGSGASRAGCALGPSRCAGPPCTPGALGYRIILPEVEVKSMMMGRSMILYSISLPGSWFWRCLICTCGHPTWAGRDHSCRNVHISLDLPLWRKISQKPFLASIKGKICFL